MPASPAPGLGGPLVRDVSEEQLLAAIFPLLPAGAATLVGPGDDAAVVAAPDGRFVVSTDVLVEDRHFRRARSTGYDVGRRAAAQNLADVAAMGARPTALVVSLVVPGDVPVAWVTGLARGLAEACSPVGAAVVGGDLSGGDAIVVAVTVHGDLEGREAVLRSGARPGDVVAHTGVLGWGAAGFALLEAGAVPDAAAGDPGPALLAARHLVPEPPLDAGPAAARAGATAMLDVSDGLLRDAGRLARASGVVVDLDPELLDADASLTTAARAVAPDGDPDAVVRAWVLGGERTTGSWRRSPPGRCSRPATAPSGRSAPRARARRRACSWRARSPTSRPAGTTSPQAPDAPSSGRRVAGSGWVSPGGSAPR
ncbi:thiamine-monophosphate kinase [Luteimicrobium album]|uniref:Thiamine-monophosphate kinase n=1 Tax=Luteimicrobium album TaxID=1054550 RepID=A0ABQ6I3Y5_9MICO|nr:thiamine-monophosphate kinase [Luteimicrobium album]